MTSPVAVLVLCGGTSRRMGGLDKTREQLGGTAVLDHLLDSLPADWPAICVGVERPTTRSVRWTRESPPGGGPVAGIAAGLASLETELCVVVGGDMPFAGRALRGLVGALEGALEGAAVIGAGPDGHAQPLLAAYRTDALRQAMPAHPGGSRLMALLADLRFVLVACDETATFDVDTPEALERARHMVGS